MNQARGAEAEVRMVVGEVGSRDEITVDEYNCGR